MSEPLSPENIAALSESIYARRKIEAIKRYREMTGLGLKEAKEAVEELEAKLRRETPERFAKGSGCLGVLVVGLVAGAGLAAAVGRVLVG